MLINDLPLEIWREVFIHACTDGGQTGYSLALVCRFFHDASKSVRFHSLSFCRLQQIEQFLAYTQKRLYPATPKVHHLLLSFASTTLDEAILDMSPISHVYGWVIARQIREQEKSLWDRQFRELVPSLLDLLAPHLETLALIQSDGFPIPQIHNRLPCLRELTLLVGISAMLNEDTIPGTAVPAMSRSAPGYSSDSKLWQLPHADPATPSLGHCADARFPALRRLHIVCGRHRDWTLREPLACLPRLAPALTHLRISNATYTHCQDKCILAFLRCASGMPYPDTQFEGDLFHTARTIKDVIALPTVAQLTLQLEERHQVMLPALRCVIVQYVPMSIALGHPGGLSRDVSNIVHGMRGHVEQRGKQTPEWHVIMLKGIRETFCTWARQTAAQWKDRVDGRSGCWNECHVH